MMINERHVSIHRRDVIVRRDRTAALCSVLRSPARACVHSVIRIYNILLLFILYYVYIIIFFSRRARSKW